MALTGQQIKDTYQSLITSASADGNTITFTKGDSTTFALTIDTGSAGANTGDITFEGIKIIGAGTGSGDGNNYSTMELVPDNDLYGNDQYLIIDPTAPNHVHIRPGGTIDSSNADLIIGGEDTHLIVSDNNSSVQMYRRATTFINSYNFTPGTGYSTAEWSSNGSTHTITLNDPTADAYTATWNISTPPGIFSVIDSDSNYHELLVLGSSTPGGPSPITITVNQAPPTNPISLNQVYFEINVYRDAYVRVTNDINIEAADDIRMYSRDVFSLRNYASDASIDITTNYDNNEYQWEFKPYGAFESPNTQATATGSFSQGDGTIASGSYSHAEGEQTQAVGDYSHAEGNSTQAIGDYSHAEGFNTEAIGVASHAEGNSTIASGSYQHVSGQYNEHNNTSSLFVVGIGLNDAERKDGFTVDVDANGSGSVMIPTTTVAFSINEDAYPSNPKTGSMFFDPINNALIIYNGTEWRYVFVSAIPY